MSSAKLRQLAVGYTSEIDNVREDSWHQLIRDFEDSTIYQSWSYGAIVSGEKKLSHLVLRENGEVVGAAQVRIAKLPLLNVGVAYVGWGPLWQRKGTEPNEDVLRQLVRALRNEFVCRRRLVLRLFPVLFEGIARCSSILAEEGFAQSPKAGNSRTILMDLSPPLVALHNGMGRMWKRNLKAAAGKQLEIVEGCDDELFGQFTVMYREMVGRKGFAEPNDIEQFRVMQSRLPTELKMHVMLCRSDEGVCAGLISSGMGNMALYLFGATSRIGLKSCGSYLLQWKLLESLKERRIGVYNLNGINPLKNPGTYKFKAELAGAHGKDVSYLGVLDSHPGFASHLYISCAEAVRANYRALKQVGKAIRNRTLRPRTVN
jgi:hypothetical protein